MKRRAEKYRKIQDVKQWRMENSKIREQHYKSERDAQVKKELLQVADD